MNKAELISAMAEKAGMSQVDCRKSLDAFMSVVSETLPKGEKIALVGFGSFSVNDRGARKGRNPQTGKEVMIPARKVVKFKAGVELAEKI